MNSFLNYHIRKIEWSLTFIIFISISFTVAINDLIFIAVVLQLL